MFDETAADNRYKALDTIWTRTGVWLVVLVLILWSITQSGPSVRTDLIKLNPSLAALYGTVFAGISVTALVFLIGIPYIRRRIVDNQNSERTGLSFRIPLPRWSVLGDTGSTRSSVAYRISIFVFAVVVTLVPAAFSVHGLGKVVKHSFLWNPAQLDLLREQFFKDHDIESVTDIDWAYPAHRKLMNVFRNQCLRRAIFEPKRLVDMNDTKHARSLANWLPLNSVVSKKLNGSIETCCGGANSSVCAWPLEPKQDESGVALLIANSVDDVFRAVTRVRSDSPMVGNLSDECAENVKYCKGVSVPLGLPQWYWLIHIPMVLAISAVLAFWWIALTPGRVVARVSTSALDRLNQNIDKSGNPNGTIAGVTFDVMRWILNRLIVAGSDVPGALRSSLFSAFLTSIVCASVGAAIASVLPLPSVEPTVGVFIGLLIIMILCQRNSGISLILAGLVIGVVVAMIGGAVLMAVVLAAGALVGYYTLETSGKRILAKYIGAENIERSATSNGYKILKELAEKAGLTTPDYWLVNVPQANAHAVDYPPGRGTIVLASSLTELLDTQELRALLAHEMGHIRNRDMTSRAFLYGWIRTTLVLAVFNQALSDIGVNLTFGQKVVSGLLVMLSPVLGGLSRAIVSRDQEFDADEFSARITGTPGKLASALTKISQQQISAMPGDLQSPKHQIATAHMMVINPVPTHWLAGIYSSHPPLKKRLEVLARLEAEYAEAGVPWKG